MYMIESDASFRFLVIDDLFYKYFEPRYVCLLNNWLFFLIHKYTHDIN